DATDNAAIDAAMINSFFMPAPCKCWSVAETTNDASPFASFSGPGGTETYEGTALTEIDSERSLRVENLDENLEETRAMSDWKLPWEGGCLCGEVRFRISAPPLLTMACHCTGCQKLSASAFSLTMAVPSEGFAVTRGEPVVGGLHGPHRQLYCPHCKNWIFTQPHGLDFF